jgi:hypothetical protein
LSTWSGSLAPQTTRASSTTDMYDGRSCRRPLEIITVYCRFCYRHFVALLWCQRVCIRAPSPNTNTHSRVYVFFYCLRNCRIYHFPAQDLFIVKPDTLVS